MRQLRMRARVGIGAVLATLLLGCGGDDDGIDPAPDAGPGDAGVAVAEPDPPAPPDMGACPTGWREEIAASGVRTCDPWPATGREDCSAPDEAHFPGTPGCARVGTACGPDPWAPDLPAGAVRFVQMGAAAGGDGTRARPFATIAEAMAGAAAGTIVAVARGTYPEAVVVRPGVTLWGACVGETRIAATTGSVSAGTVTASGRGSVVRNVMIGGARTGIWIQGSGRALELHDVVVANATGAGIAVYEAGSLTGDRVVVRDTVLDGNFGRGLEVDTGGQVDLVQVVVLANRLDGVGAIDPGTMVRLADASVVRTSGTPGGQMGVGVDVDLGAGAVLERIAVEDNEYLGIQSAHQATVTVTAAVVRGTRAERMTRRFGNGVSAVLGGRVEVRRATISGNRSSGVVAGAAAMDGTAASMLLEDVVIRDSLPREVDGALGGGIGVGEGGVIEGARVWLEGNLAIGVLAQTASRVTLSDLVVRDTESQMVDLAFGRGVESQEGSEIRLTRAAITGNRSIGVAATVGGFLRAEHVLIADTRSEETGGVFGFGAQAAGGGRLELDVASILRSQGMGVMAVSPGSTIGAVEVRVEDTAAQACAATTCASDPLGYAVGGYGGGAVDVRSFRFARSALLGAQVVGGGSVDLHDGVIADLPIGFNVQGEYDVSRLRDGVTLESVATEIDTSTIPSPAEAPPMGI